MVSGRSLGRAARLAALSLVWDTSLGHALGQTPASLCDQAAATAAAMSSVPEQVLLAITRVETGRRHEGALQPWPWSINLDGEGHWFSNAAEAIDFAHTQLALGIENFDVGCFQINLRWHGAEFASLEDAFDPQANATYAARFLSELYNSEGGWPEAVAAYHSRTEARAAEYLIKVEAVLAELEATARSEVPVYVAAVPRENRFPFLQKGRFGDGASLVPRLNDANPLIGAP